MVLDHTFFGYCYHFTIENSFCANSLPPSLVFCPLFPHDSHIQSLNPDAEVEYESHTFQDSHSCETWQKEIDKCKCSEVHSLINPVKVWVHNMSTWVHTPLAPRHDIWTVTVTFWTTHILWCCKKCLTKWSPSNHKFRSSGDFCVSYHENIIML